MNTVYIALGSNVGDRLDFLRKGKNTLGSKVNIIATSSVYDTEPIGTIAQDRFLNAVVAAQTDLSPQEVLSICLEIEQENGRVREAKDGPRTLDLDLLLYNELRTDKPELTLPHPRMHERAFVLAPLCDIDPGLLHPMLGISMHELLDQCAEKEDLIKRTEYAL